MFISGLCFAQSDTSYYYYTKDNHQTIKDSAYAFVKFYKQGDVWHGKDYYVKTGKLKSEGNYADSSVKTPLGLFNNYSEGGKLDNVSTYTNGKPVEITFYYEGGNKKSWISFDEKGVKQQKGWDENGKEIEKYVVMQSARFKKGEDAWNKYLKKNTNGNVALDAGAPPGEYKVEVVFKVGRDGYITNAKAILIPAKCRACANEALRVINESDKWEPAIFQNKPADYWAGQPFTFVVPEEKKKKG